MSSGNFARRPAPGPPPSAFSPTGISPVAASVVVPDVEAAVGERLGDRAGFHPGLASEIGDGAGHPQQSQGRPGGEPAMGHTRLPQREGRGIQIQHG